jgi:hypothetical protein
LLVRVKGQEGDMGCRVAGKELRSRRMHVLYSTVLVRVKGQGEYR